MKNTFDKDFKFKIDIGGGNNPKAGFNCVDKCKGAFYRIDVDSKELQLPFQSEFVGEIYSSNCFEHIENLIPLMNECWRVLAWGSKMTIIVPHRDCVIATQDPTHKRFFNTQSMKYFSGYYTRRYKLDYGIRCIFRVESIDVNIKDGEIFDGETLPYIKEITFVLRKDVDYYNMITAGEKMASKDLRNEYYDKIKEEEVTRLSRKRKVDRIENKNNCEYLISKDLVMAEFKLMIKSLVDLFSQKNVEYENAYFRKNVTNEERFKQDICRKFSRLQTIYNSDDIMVSGEFLSVIENLKDLAIYSIMEMIALRYTYGVNVLCDNLLKGGIDE